MDIKQILYRIYEVKCCGDMNKWITREEKNQDSQNNLCWAPNVTYRKGRQTSSS